LHLGHYCHFFFFFGNFICDCSLESVVNFDP
jgi:hypothetical protein